MLLTKRQEVFFAVLLLIGGMIGLALAWRPLVYRVTGSEQEARAAVVAERAAAGIYDIALLADRMEPNTLLITVGGRVQFNSRDGRRHEIAQGHGDDYGDAHDHVVGGVSSGEFGADEAYRVTFSKPGIYSFHDNLDSRLSATIVVYVPEQEN